MLTQRKRSWVLVVRFGLALCAAKRLPMAVALSLLCLLRRLLWPPLLCCLRLRLRWRPLRTPQQR